MDPRQGVARGDSGVIDLYVRAVGPGQAHDPGVLGGDELQRADSLLNVPARTRGEIAEQERAGKWSAKHGGFPCGCSNMDPGTWRR